MNGIDSLIISVVIGVVTGLVLLVVEYWVVQPLRKSQEIERQKKVRSQGTKLQKVKQLEVESRDAELQETVAPFPQDEILRESATGDQSFWSLQFGFSGRVGRRTWWLRGALPFVAINGAVIEFLNYVPVSSLTLICCLAALLAVAWWMWIALTVKRLRDRNKLEWWWVLASLVPYLNLVVFVWLWVECGFLP